MKTANHKIRHNPSNDANCTEVETCNFKFDKLYNSPNQYCIAGYFIKNKSDNNTFYL